MHTHDLRDSVSWQWTQMKKKKEKYNNNNTFYMYCTLNMKDTSQSTTGEQIKTVKGSNK